MQYADYFIDWCQSTNTIDRFIRAVTYPYPGAKTFMNENPVIIWKARPFYKKYITYIPGRIVERSKKNNLVVMTVDGVLELLSHNSPNLQVGWTLK